MKTFTYIFLLLATLSVKSQSYIPDVTFGANGVVKDPNTSIPKNPSNIFLIDNSYYFFDTNSLYRFDYAGNFDTSFGTNGIATVTGIAGLQIINAKAENGFFYLYGYSDAGGSKNIVIAKTNINGVFEQTFGTNGIAEINFGGSEEATDIYVSPNGNIYVLGTKDNAMFVSLVNPNGTINYTFDSNGYKTYATPPGGFSTSGGKIFAYQGNILISGTYPINNGNYHIEIFLRLIDANGISVNTFGVGGLKSIYIDGYPTHTIYDARLIGNNLYVSLFYGFSFNDNGYSLLKYDVATSQKLFYVYMAKRYPAFAVDQNDKVLITGWSSTCYSYCESDYTVSQINADGTLNTSFANGGYYTYNFQYPGVTNYVIDQASALHIDETGKIVIAGFSQPGTAATYNLGLLRIKEGVLSIDGASNIETRLFSLFPNPADGIININATNRNIDRFIIYDMSGKKVMEESGNVTSFSVAHLQNGMYFLTIYSGDVPHNLKFIKS